MTNTPTQDATGAQYKNWEAVLAALDRIEQGENTARLRATGQWTPGEILDHLARFMRATLDGFGPGRPPLPLRVLGRLFKPMALSVRPTPKGIPLKGPIGEVLLPTPGRDFASALSEVRAQIARVHPAPPRDPYIAASPLFGAMNAEEWTWLHLKHFRHHLDYLEITPGEAPDR